MQSYEFSHILVDPPRAGLSDETISLSKQFKNMLYISCNPETLANNLRQISQTHDIQSVAVFDQFPWTDHLESGVLLQRKV
jgi:tRNA (uracil-5-)-methyltransferase